MKYELGDKVRIKKHWKKVDQHKQIIEKGIENLDEHLRSDDMQGCPEVFDRFRKESIDEIGYIAGAREIKVKYGLIYCWEDSFDTGMGMMPEVDEIRLDDWSDKFEKIYLVATRMNCLRRVSFEDIEYIGGGN